VRPLRVLHVTQGYFPAIGGTERLVQRLSEELVRQFGDEVTVFTTNCYSGEGFNRPRLPRMPVGTEERGGVRVRRFPVRARLSRLLERPQSLAYRHRLALSQYLRTAYQGPIVPGLGRAIRAQPADVVAATSFPLLHMATALRAAGASGRPCVFYGGLHPDDDWGFGRPWIYAAMQRAARYVAYTRFEADFVRSRGVDAERVRVIPLGVDAERFGGVGREEARRRLGLPADAPVVGFVGQLGLHKGVDTLLEAMPLVWRSRPETRLMIAGARAVFAGEIDRVVAGWPGRWRERTLLRYGFDESEKPALYAALDVFTYPSGYESFGIAFLEAWASGLPVVGCRRGAIPDVVDAGRDGLLVPYTDEELLARAIVTLLDSPDWRRSLGEAGRRKVLAGLTWDRVARRFREALAGPYG
jgi:glycosyltransferase involved in cell wall biosynthesis